MTTFKASHTSYSPKFAVFCYIEDPVLPKECAKHEFWPLACSVLSELENCSLADQALLITNGIQ